MQIVLNGIIIGGIYALVAIGFNLIFASVRFYHILYGGLAILGVYFTWTFQDQLGWNFFLSGFLGAILAGLAGMAAWQFLYRPIVNKKSSDLILLLISFGSLIVVQNTIALIWKNNSKSISIQDTIQPGYEWAGLTITFNQLVILFVALAAVILLELFLGYTKYGLGIRAIGDNAELTTILGLKTNQIILLIFFISTFMSSLGGTLISLEIGVRPIYGLFLVLKAIIASIIGGVGSMRGAFLGGLLLGITENLGIYFLGAQWQEVTAFSLLTLFILFRPQGLFIKRQIGN